MNPFVAKFIEDVLSEVKYIKAHAHIINELEDHIELLKASYMEEGLEENKAYKKAVIQMGEAHYIGKSLHNVHKPKLEWSVLILIIALISLGLMALYYCGEYIGAYGFLKKQVICVILGGIVLIGMYFLNYKKLEKWSTLGYILGICILIYGKYFSEAKWIIGIGPIVLMSVVVAIPILVISFAGIVHRWGDNNIKNYWILGAIAMCPNILIVQKGISYGIVLGTISLMVLTFHIIKSKKVREKIKLLRIMYGTLLGGISLIVVVMLNRKAYMIDRIKGFIYPEGDPFGLGYMPTVMKEIREASTFLGNGGFANIDIRRLPKPTNDVIFTFIVGSMGWLIGSIVILMICGIIIRMFQAAFKVNESYGRLINLSIASLFALQFIYNIGMNLGYVPQTAIPLPFVSYGGTATVLNMALIGLFLSIYRRKDIVFLESYSRISQKGDL